MKGFVDDIGELAGENSAFRRVLYTGKHLQLVIMSIEPGGEIGEEVHHDHDQFFRIEDGHGEMWIDGQRTPVHEGDAILVPARAWHNLVNTGKKPLRFCTLYGPPEHKDGVMHRTRDDAEVVEEHFDGKTTEAGATDSEDQAPHLV